MRLFIADDSELLRSHLVNMISELKEIEIVGQVRNARDAVESIRRLNPDVVILDIHMPDGNGISVLEKIREDKNLAKVIIFTNFPYVQYRKRCMEAGADYFFYKATEFERLMEVLKQLIPEYSQIEKPE